jgi:hypothetical protein
MTILGWLAAACDSVLYPGNSYDWSGAEDPIWAYNG